MFDRRSTAVGRPFDALGPTLRPHMTLLKFDYLHINFSPYSSATNTNVLRHCDIVQPATYDKKSNGCRIDAVSKLENGNLAQETKK